MLRLQTDPLSYYSQKILNLNFTNISVLSTNMTSKRTPLFSLSKNIISKTKTVYTPPSHLHVAHSPKAGMNSNASRVDKSILDHSELLPIRDRSDRHNTIRGVCPVDILGYPVNCYIFRESDTTWKMFKTHSHSLFLSF